MQCLQLSLRTRFPFHDSQVLCWSLKSPQERPKRRPRGPKRRQEAAKRRQDSAEKRQVSTKRCQDAPKSDFGAIWARFWTPRGGKNLDFRCNCRQNSRFSCFSKRLQKRGPKVPKGDPREAKMPPRSAPGAPRSGPRGAKTAPGAARSAPREPQEPPKRRKKETKKVTTFVCALRGGPGAPWEPPWSDFGAFLEPPGWHFGAIFERFFFV